jgi:hypothetical protein
MTKGVTRNDVNVKCRKLITHTRSDATAHLGGLWALSLRKAAFQSIDQPHSGHRWDSHDPLRLYLHRGQIGAQRSLASPGPLSPR